MSLLFLSLSSAQPMPGDVLNLEGELEMASKESGAGEGARLPGPELNCELLH